MLVRLLGPVEVVVDGAPKTPAGKRERALVALLALTPGETVATEDVAAGLWGALVPPEGTLDALAERVRADTGPVLESTDDGLRLVVDAADVDALEVAALAETAADQEPAAALVTLDRALALWRGPVLAGVQDVPFARPVVDRLTELRSSLVEERFEVMFRLHRHPEVIEELRELARANPTRERLWGQLMTALHVEHRTQEALEVYADARAVLADELGIEPGEALQRLEAAILLEDPAHDRARGDRAAPRPAARLPVPRTPTFGRDELVARVGLELRQPGARLVTLTGMGGTGKTRVAVVVAARLRDVDGRDVSFVEVSRAETADDVVAAVTMVVGEPDAETAADGTGPLVVLDNVDACVDGAGAVSRLLEEIPGLCLLVTARMALRLAGEQVVGVGPLDVPAVGATPAEIMASPAVQLFTRIARQADPQLDLGGREEGLAEVCRLLDGVPLALELAAARLRLVGMDGLRDSVRSGLELLRTTAPDVPERQRALASTIAWSYERLSEADRRLCRRLAVFEQAFTLEAVEAVAADLGDVIDGLTHVMEAGLTRTLVSRVRIGFVMPAPVRAFLRGLSGEPHELGATKLALAGYLLENVTRWHADLDRAEGQLALGRFLDVGREVHASIDAALRLGRIEQGVALTLASGPFWVASGELRPGLARTMETVQYVARESADAGRLYSLAGEIAYHLTDYDLAVDHLGRAIAVAEGLGDEATLAISRCFLGASLLVSGEAERGGELVRLGAETAQRLDLYPTMATALSVLAISYAVAGDFERERSTHLARLEVTRQHGDIARTADALSILAEIALDEADAATARSFAEEALAIADPALPMEAREALITLARAQVAAGDLDTATRTLERAFDAAVRIGQSLALAQCYRVAGCLAAARGRSAESVRLFAAAQRLVPSPSGADDPVEADLYGGLETARAALGPQAVGREWTLGLSLPPARVRDLFQDVVAVTPRRAAR